MDHYPIALGWITSSVFKLLFIPAYRSTDFEVHRHWLALTHSLPLKQWYFDETSQWTLDYPPFFAWFEYALGFLAFDTEMLRISNLNYASPNTVLFLRLSVILVDVCLAVGSFLYFYPLDTWILPSLLLYHPAFLIIDHIHFQYNGFLFGILLLSLAAFKSHYCYLGAFLFAALLNFKHIFLYIAPAVFVYLLSTFCFKYSRFQALRFVKLGALVTLMFGVSFGPFIDQLPQLMSRLFPFKRGLCHVYWAPNVWALYSFIDRVVLLVINRLNLLALPIINAHSPTRGILGDSEFSVLPQITPMICLLCTGLAQLPFLWKLWRRPHNFSLFLVTIIHCGMASFSFGWHVHEKAILLVILPLHLLAFDSLVMSQVYFVFNFIAVYSLFPLLIDPAETAIKWGVFVTYFALTWTLFDHFHQSRGQALHLPSWAVGYLVGFAAIEWFSVFGHPLLFGPTSFPFLPLMLTSVYCAFGLLGCWLTVVWMGDSVFQTPSC